MDVTKWNVVNIYIDAEDEDEEILAIPYQEVLYHPEPVHISIFDLSI